MEGGKWYYEVLLGTSASARIGFATTDWQIGDDPAAAIGDENGDIGESWAWDGSKQTRYHNGELPYASAVSWARGDRVGCCLDLVEGTVSYTHNGKDLGVAFRSVRPDPNIRIYPIATLSRGPHLFRFSIRECEFFMNYREATGVCGATQQITTK